MQHWNGQFYENNQDNSHEEQHNEVTNRQSDFDFRPGNFNMHFGNDNYGNPNWGSDNRDNINQAFYNNERFEDQQQNNYRFDNRERDFGRDWNQFENEENHKQWRNNNGPTFRNLNSQSGSHYGETYNHQNRNVNPYFADDEGGFSGGFRNDNEGNGFNRDFGFDNNDSFHNRHWHWPENNTFDNSGNEGENRWHPNYSNQNRGGFFGH